MHNRSQLIEMSQQLAQQNSANSVLTALREHAAKLLGLDDVLVMLRCEDAHTFACVSVSARHFDLAVLSLDSRHHPMLMHCLQQHCLSVSNGKTKGDAEMCRLLSTQNVVALPLLTAKQVLGLMVVAVSSLQLTQLQNRTRFLQAFGLHAGTALARHLNDSQALDARIASIKREQLINTRQMTNEVSNPLNIIQDYLRLMDDRMAASQPEHADLSVISDEAQRVAHIVAQSNPNAEALMLEPIDMAQVVREMVLLLQASRAFPDNITLQCSWPSHSSLVMGSPDLIKQILINLIRNARENLPDGGLIGVSGGTLVEQANQRYIQLSVRDTGANSSVGQQGHMLEPVSRDKISTSRSQGLNVVHQLVQKMHGQIRYLSSPKGVRYEVLLPAAHH